MDANKVFLVSLIVMIAALVCMGLNLFVLPFPDAVIRVIGVMLIVDLFIFTYSLARMKRK